jgi:hypothetical protein
MDVQQLRSDVIGEELQRRRACAHCWLQSACMGRTSRRLMAISAVIFLSLLSPNDAALHVAKH